MDGEKSTFIAAGEWNEAIEGELNELWRGGLSSLHAGVGLAFDVAASSQAMVEVMGVDVSMVEDTAIITV